MTYSVRHCPIHRNDYDTEVEYYSACEEYLDGIRALGYTVIQAPDARGYYHIDKGDPND